MPRQLPWKVGPTDKRSNGRSVTTSNSDLGASSPSARNAHSSSSKANMRPSTAKDERPVLSSKTARGKDISHRPQPSRSRSRSPSTSPPPEPLGEEYMIEGPRFDDRYRMVEDEFLAVAGEFTRHLHAAEYQRLKSLASSKNAQTIHDISRPVTSAPTDAVRRRHAKLETAARQQKGLAKVLRKRRADHDSDSEEKPWTGTSLQGLMDSPRKKQAPLNRSLSSLSASALESRTARRASPSLDRAVRLHGRLGNGKPPSEGERDDHEDDDSALDGHISWSPKLQRARDTLSVQDSTRRRPFQTSTHASLAANFQNPRSTKISSANAHSHKQTSNINRTHGSSDQDEDEDDIDLFSRIRSRRLGHRRKPSSPVIKTEVKTEDSQSATSLHEIPFL
ncbi:hypothetical protein B0T20DRAFT_170490 [Sordaria brevicollis]|uniref:Uncharacterized protein n=1 Tax=Sordaria brevicollis TaxID=83679 RepID=A0AAE0PH70_SORBR|nr:hypothetical protein B0T20DRAFT_170490 [Sordaria brevicollis]